MINETFEILNMTCVAIILVGGLLFVAGFGFWIILTQVPDALDCVRKKYE